MSLQRRFEWVCDGCGRVVPDDSGDPEIQEGDVLMPERWVHTMVGDDLCPWCKP